MDCKIMKRLKDAETLARKMAKTALDSDSQTLYRQLALDAVRVQNIHWESCYECQTGDKNV